MFKRLLLPAVAAMFVCFSALVLAQTRTAATVDWELTSLVLGHDLGERLKLKVDQEQLSGFIYRGENVALKGTVKGSEVAFSFKESDGTTTSFTGHAAGDAMSSSYVTIDPHGIETTGSWSARWAVQREKNIGTPRAENAEFLMSIGLDGSLDSAIRSATSDLAAWLQSDYGLCDSDVGALLGSSIQYNISEVADRHVGVVAKIPKRTLMLLKPASSAAGPVVK